MSQNFEPYIDYEALTSEMVKDLHSDMTAYHKNCKAFALDDSKEKAIRVMKSHAELTTTFAAILATLYTKPMMVHVAGPKNEEDEDEHRSIVQRCSRCGSVLQFWREGMGVMSDDGVTPYEEEQAEWWEEGDIVAKSVSDTGMDMYRIHDRELESHELPCLDMNGILDDA